jgi:hypothetical protein
VSIRAKSRQKTNEKLEILNGQFSIQTQRSACAFPVRLSLGAGGRALPLRVSRDSGPKNRTKWHLLALDPA